MLSTVKKPGAVPAAPRLGRLRYGGPINGISFAGPIAMLPFDEDDAKVAGEVRAALEAEGKPIWDYDLLIAGQGLRNEFTLVTSNVSEFARVKGLVWQDWARHSWTGSLVAACGEPVRSTLPHYLQERLRRMA